VTRLTIFDCEGVLVDIEPIAMRLLDTIAEAGLLLDPAEGYERFLGRSLASITALLAAEGGLVIGPEALAAMRERLCAAFRAGLRPTPGIAEAPAAMPNPFYVASPERVELSLRVAGLRSRFERGAFSATMVARGKRAPDLFLYAAKVMGYSRRDCTVVEDSPAVILVARAAGIRAVAFVDGTHAMGRGAPGCGGAGGTGPGDRGHALPRRGGRRLTMALLAAVDVGTASARAGIFDASGRLLARAERPIALNQPAPGRAEHDSTDIWTAVCGALRVARAEARVPAEAVLGLGFDATCSLVPAGPRRQTARPRRLGRLGHALHHRAQAEAAECTALGGSAAARSGGAMSPKMQLPELLWLKRRRPELWARTGHLFELADFLTWQATGSTDCSDCTIGCKWGYRPETGGWPDDLLARCGLADLRARGGLPDRASPIGSAIGRLTAAAAAELDLAPSTPVAAGLVDAHAGVLGGLAGDPTALARRPTLIGGPSSCLITLAPTPRTAPGSGAGISAIEADRDAACADEPGRLAQPGGRHRCRVMDVDLVSHVRARSDRVP
jgi:HAD superfamily hydrolase (TIGR01509 family)